MPRRGAKRPPQRGGGGGGGGGPAAGGAGGPGGGGGGGGAARSSWGAGKWAARRRQSAMEPGPPVGRVLVVSAACWSQARAAAAWTRGASEAPGGGAGPGAG